MYEYNDEFFNSIAGINKFIPIIDNIVDEKFDTDEYKVLQEVGQSLECLKGCFTDIISNFDNIVIIGMGGAILNPKAILGVNT